MRTIKFRAKRVGTHEWVYGHLFQNPVGEWKIKKGFREYLIKPETVGQFTNHHDRKGKEIYEGDIVLSKGKYPYTVEWITDGFLMRGRIYGGITSIKAFLPNQREVIGNIYDNPELVKQDSND